MKLFLLLLDISNFDTVTNHNVNVLEIEVCWAGCGPQDEDHCNIRLRYAGPLCGQSIARGYTKLRNVLARSRLYYKKKGVTDPLQYEASKVKYKWLMNEYKI